MILNVFFKQSIYFIHSQFIYCMYFGDYGSIYWYSFVNRRRYNQNYYWPPYRTILISWSGKHGFNHLANSFSKSTGGIFSRSFAFNSRGCLSRAIKKLSCGSLHDRSFLRCNPWLCHGNLFSLEYFWFVYLHAACSRHRIWFYYSSLVFGITKLASGNLANETIILAGIILSSFMSALISLIVALSPEEDVRQVLYWLMGSVSMRGWSHIQILGPFFLVGTIMLLLHVKELNGLAFGDQSAQFMGIDVKKKKKNDFNRCIRINRGCGISIWGNWICWLSYSPRSASRSGANHKHVLPLSILIGGSYLVLADLLARTILEPRELPIGVVTALIGSPILRCCL